MIDIFKTKYSDWNSLERTIEAIGDNKAKGDAFEYFCYFYLKFLSDLHQIKEIYCPIVDNRPFPKHVVEKLRLEKTDYGVDGVFINNAGDYIAWQAKFRSGRTGLTSRELSTFWAEAEYADYRLIISNTHILPNVAHKKTGHLSALVDRFISLDEDFFSSLYQSAISQNIQIERDKKSPRPYQSEILQDIISGFSSSDRGKLIAACGIGKTLIALWTLEHLQADNVIFFAPSLQLVRQTLEEWSAEASSPFQYLCVCSDQTVDAEVDSNNIDIGDIDIPVTTSAEAVRDFIAQSTNKKKFIFSTYQSAEVIKNALSENEDGFSFDITFYDEAHRTAGVTNSQFNIALDDAAIKTKKKLFLTATERLVRPKLSSKLEEHNLSVFSMNDKSIYGDVFHRLTFGEAIEKNIISDYRIVFTGISSSEYNQLIKNNFYVTDGDSHTETVQNIYKIALLKKSIQDLGLTKVISFHSKISESRDFANRLSAENSFGDRKTAIAHINGAMTAQDRAEIIQNFEDSELGVITNVRCLTEGIDIPLIDAVFFADPKGSMIDIVQAVGRAVRQKFGETGRLSYIIVPVLLDQEGEDVLSGAGFEALFNLIQAMRDQDKALAEWIDSINLAAAKGRIKGSSSVPGKVVINLPTELNTSDFEDALLLRIADVNKNPTGTIGVGSKLGKNERKGDFTRIFKTLCDYTPTKLEESLIAPTFEIITDNPDAIYASKEIRINNNNVSHCKRVGFLHEVERNKYQLSKLGLLYKQGQISFLDALRNQFLLYREEHKDGILFPYREAISFMLEIKNLNYIQFLYSLFSIQFNDGKPDLELAISVAKEIDAAYPNILLTNEANKNEILKDLNSRYEKAFSYNNVWTDRTTAGNQYRYLMRHLEIFDECFTSNKNIFLIIKEKEAFLASLLVESEKHISKDYGDTLWVN